MINLKARPIFHQKRDSIKAHLTVVFAALAMSRLMQDATVLSIKKSLRIFKVIQTDEVLINGKKRKIGNPQAMKLQKPLELQRLDVAPDTVSSQVLEIHSLGFSSVSP